MKDSIMRKIAFAGLAVSLCALALPAAAQTASAQRGGAQEQQRDTEADNPNRRICVSERLSGSRIPRTVCRTAREWRDLQANSDD